jgi:hypothetical protein
VYNLYPISVPVTSAMSTSIEVTPIRIVCGRPGCRVRGVGAPTRGCTVAEVSGRKSNEKSGSQI